MAQTRVYPIHGHIWHTAVFVGGRHRPLPSLRLRCRKGSALLLEKLSAALGGCWIALDPRFLLPLVWGRSGIWAPSLLPPRLREALRALDCICAGFSPGNSISCLDLRAHSLRRLEVGLDGLSRIGMLQRQAVCAGSPLAGCSSFQQSPCRPLRLTAARGCGVLNLVAAIIVPLPMLGCIPELAPQAFTSIIQPSANQLLGGGLHFFLQAGPGPRFFLDLTDRPSPPRQSGGPQTRPAGFPWVLTPPAPRPLPRA